jgi:YteA family regulatory protein
MKEVVVILTSQQLSHFQSELQKAKEEIEWQLTENDHYGLVDEHYRESASELSTYDNHPGDEGTELFEREKDIALNQHSEYELKNIERALEAMNNGTYGKCLECGKDIPLERLKAIPSTLFCIDHTPDRTVSHNRPIEEGVLMPPFGKFNFDNNLDEDVAYDAEDSWQDVAQYGTSESPSDFVNPPDHYNDMYVDSGENVGYVEDFENFIGTDMEGKNQYIFPNEQYKLYKDVLDEENIMTTFGDLPRYEHDPYVEDDDEDKR